MQAFHQLVDAHASYLFGVARAMLGRSVDAEDVVQETFLAAIKGLRRFEGRSQLRTWLVTILTRQVAMWRRKQAWRREAGKEGWPLELAGADQGGEREADAKMDVMSMLERLAPEHREVLILREYEGMSYEQMAEALGVPMGTVESRLYRARQELKGKLKGYE